MKAFIVTEGYQSTGYGHITRCLSIYQAFMNENIKPLMLVNGDEDAKHFLSDADYELFNWLDNPQPLYNKIKNSDIVIVDSYKAGVEIYKELYKNTKLLAAVDDFMRLDYNAHVIINGTIGSETFNYKRNNSTEYLLGAKYIPLRKEFWNVEEKKININISDILITMGGQDVRNLTQPILEHLLIEFPNFNYHVVAKKNFNIDFAQFEKLENVNFIYDADALKMKELMLNCDVAVTAAGQTIYELARTGIPSIAIVVADNQIKNLQGWITTGFISKELYYNSDSLLSDIAEEINYLNSPGTRMGYSIIGQSSIDGKGANYICARLLAKFRKETAFYFRNARIEDAKIVYDLSNDLLVRANSINQDIIDWEKHIIWMRSKVGDPNHLFLLVFSREHKFIGQVRFNKTNDAAEVGISITGQFRGKSLSSVILQNACKEFFIQFPDVNIIRALIRPENQSSIRSFNKAGFVFDSTESINNEIFNLYLLKK